MRFVFQTRREKIYARHGDSLVTILTILLAFLMFIGAPAAAYGATFTLIGGFIILVMIAVAVILNGNLMVLMMMLAAFAMNAASVVLRAFSPSVLDIYLAAAAWLILSSAWAWTVARNLFAPGRVTYHRVVGGIFLYLLVAMAFASLYMFVGAADEEAFKGLVVVDTPDDAAHLIYFSLVTLTTVGYGDIVPVSPFARSLANLESAFGALYPATLIARLVSLEINGHKET